MLFLLAALGADSVTTEAGAKTRRPQAAQAGEETPSSDYLSLRSHFALQRLEQGLNQKGDERLRHLERLATNGSKAAVEVMTHWLEEDSPTLDKREWLAVARALAPNARHLAARDWLARIFGGAPLADTEGDAELEQLARATAGLGLARLGTTGSIAKLGRALRQGRSLALLAQQALLAHPPLDSRPLFQAPGAPTSTYIETLELLGDQRAFVPLRDLVRRGAPEVAARAALALFRMGHLETVELAEHWLATASEHDVLLGAATEILLAVGSPAAATAMDELLRRAPDRAVHLAHQLPNPHVSAPLDAHFQGLDLEQQGVALAALATSSDPIALRRLDAAFETPELELHAALALARSPNPSAEKLLNGKLQGDKRRTAVRALVVRGWLQGRTSSTLDDALRGLVDSNDATDRWLGWWGQASASDETASKLLSSDDSARVAAATSTLLAHSDELARLAARRLDDARDEELIEALAGCLALRSAAEAVATSTLERVTRLSPQLAVLAQPWHARRDTPEALWQRSPAVDRTLERSALAHLGDNPASAALGVLRSAYLKSSDERTRRTVVRALSRRRQSGPRDRLLAMARDFDPDPGVRHLARLAARGPIEESIRGQQVLWLSLGEQAANQVVVLTTDAGGAFSIKAAPDGQVVVLGFDDAPVDARWAPRSQ